MFVSRLEQSGAFRTTVLATSGVTGSLLLRTHLVEIYHDASTSPGVARVTVTAELSDTARGCCWAGARSRHRLRPIRMTPMAR
jgi:hypothetical protein